MTTLESLGKRDTIWSHEQRREVIPDNIHLVVELLLISVSLNCSFISNLLVRYGIAFDEMKARKFFRQLLTGKATMYETSQLSTPLQKSLRSLSD